jgi:hypothetical protein
MLVTQTTTLLTSKHQINLSELLDKVYLYPAIFIKLLKIKKKIMKHISSLVVASLFSATAALAQCSPVLNNYEVKLSQVGSQTLRVQMRYHANAVAGATDITPTKNIKLDGIVMGITWPKTSNVELTEIKSSSKDFDLIFDKSLVSNKTSQDNIKSIFHNNITSMPKNFSENWENDQWYDVATINFTGTLSKGDYFSLLNCDYGIVNPNSYNGNSTTDPWFAMMDENGTYVQYSPKMITETPSLLASSFNVYPVPTTGELNIQVESPARTSAAVKVMDVTGKLVKAILFELEKGNNTNMINISELPAGEYMLQLTDGKAINFVKQISKQ